jgi:hypothetical protein
LGKPCEPAAHVGSASDNAQWNEYVKEMAEIQKQSKAHH